MFSANPRVRETIADFRLEGLIMRYSVFMPRLYNLSRSLGMEPGKIMPSRAFCSDENQGYPIILVAKHFGTFPFNHGVVGGIVATDRHGPHAHHGKDLVIIQASHVGYDPGTGGFGTYRRLQTADNAATPTCGKVCDVLDWYRDEHRFAQANIFLARNGDEHTVTIDNHLLRENREEGLFLHLERFLRTEGDGQFRVLDAFSTSKCYLLSEEVIRDLQGYAWQPGRGEPIGERLLPEWFFFRRAIAEVTEGHGHLERNLLKVMPEVITAPAPALTAAQVNTQVEFDRAFRTIARSQAYQGKRVLFVSGLNIDVSPEPGQLFPLTKFVPWAAYYQDADGRSSIWEQAELAERLLAQPTENPDEVDLEAAIQAMGEAREIRVRVNR